MNVWAKRLAVALALSVGLNLFLGSFIAAHVLRRGPWHGHGEAYGPFFGPRGMMHDTRGAGADAMRGVMSQHGEAFRAARERLRQAQQGVRAALAAEPYDPQALERALGDLRASTADSQKLMHAALVDLARSLPPEQRRRLARDGHGLGRGGPPGPDGF